ncbi:DUF305 domain-containing protein [Rhizobium sp. YIM 134829]|uniref:CopM family metallochaperone n=1 Tax=Rhizobium sp. YIM 134829 TaxID=3390453 RepID=UPI00397C9601
MSSRTIVRAAAAGALLTIAALTMPLVAAQAQEAGHSGHSMSGDMAMPMDDQVPSNQAFAAANDKMMNGMSIDYTGKPDVDFARSMIAHHQGAIDMAKVELQYGKDAEIRALAEGIIAAQEKEIAEMKAWLAKNGG